MTGSSWGRLLATGSLKVDENAPGSAAGGALFLALALGYGLLVSAWAELLANPPPLPRRLAFTGLAVASLMLPMLSNDIFSLFAYGSVAAAGHDVYTTASWLNTSPFAGFLGQMWSRTVCVYGPTTLLATMPSALAHGNPWFALLVIRALWLLPTIVVMELSFRVFRARPFFHAMVWLNPLWLVDGPGQLHSDLLGVVAVTGGILLQESGRLVGAWAAFAVAASGKYSFLFSGLWFWLSGTRSLKQRLLRVPAIASVVTVVAASAYALFWHGTRTLTSPLHALSSMNPGGSITEIVGHLVHVLRGGPMTPPSLDAEQFVAMERAMKGPVWAVTMPAVRALALTLGLRALYLMLRARPTSSSPRDPDVVALGTGAVIVAVITLASHRFLSWYLLAALPFFGLECTRVWRQWWVAIVAASVSVNFVNVLPKSSPFLPIWAVISNGAVVVIFLWSLRGRYWTLGTTPPGRGPDSASAPPEATAPEARS